MGKLVGAGEVLAVPGDQKVAPVLGHKRKVQRVAHRIGRHEMVLDVRLNDLENGSINGHNGQGRDQFDAVVPGGEVATLELVDDGEIRDELDTSRCVGPPLARAQVLRATISGSLLVSK